MPVKITEEDLVKEQMKVIDNLQDKINLQKFDIIENLKQITRLKQTLKRRKEIVFKAIHKLEGLEMPELKDIIYSLKMMHIRENEEDEQ